MKPEAVSTLLNKMSNPIWAIKFSEQWHYLNGYLTEKYHTQRRLSELEAGEKECLKNIISMLTENVN